MAADEIYSFIASKTTYASTIAPKARNLDELSRDVRNVLLAISYPVRVGEIRDFPLAIATENFLLCDGSELAKQDFPELAAYLLQEPEYQATDPDNFLLPNYIGARAQAPTAPPQVIGGGSVGIGTPPPPPPTTPGGAGGGNGQPPSGGRPRENERER